MEEFMEEVRRSLRVQRDYFPRDVSYRVTSLINLEEDEVSSIYGLVNYVGFVLRNRSYTGFIEEVAAQNLLTGIIYGGSPDDYREEQDILDIKIEVVSKEDEK